MSLSDPEIETLRAQVNCATLLERAQPPWRLDRRQSTPNALKYRRGQGEILIISHKGMGWWDPQSDEKGDVFHLVQHLDPSLNFGQVRKFLRPLAGIAPSFPPVQIHSDKRPERSIAERWAKRPPIRKGSEAWQYLNLIRCLPPQLLNAAQDFGSIREGLYGSAWFAHHKETSQVTHVEIRGPTFRGSLGGGAKCLFRFQQNTTAPHRFVLTEAPIDALSVASIESVSNPHLSNNTLYGATGGGMGPATIEAIRNVLSTIKDKPRPIFCSATDANTAGDRYAERHQEIAANIGVPFHRLRPPIAKGDWNDILKQLSKRSPFKDMPATFNARVEMVAEKPMFRDAYKKRGCIVPASGFYEWTGDKKARQPHLFTSSDGAPILALAGLWDRWRDPSNGEEILSCTLIVTEASEWMTPYHDRMPAVLAQAEIDRWLRGEMEASELHPAREERFSEYMVSSRLNRTGMGDDDPTIIEPAF